MKKPNAAKGKTESKNQTTKNNQPMTTTANKTEGKKAQPEFEKKNYVMVPVNMITIDESFNPREDYGDIDELMRSIAENGLRNPVKGFQKEGKLFLSEGFRRMRAVRLAIEKGFQIDRVPMFLEERLFTEEERTLEFLINNEGKPFTMLEQSIVIGRLLNFRWKVTDIVKKTGKARGYIENLITLTKTPMVVQNYMKEDKISAHAVIGIMAAEKDNPEAIVTEVEKAIKKAEASGKEKATPKHVEPKEKGPSFGKFYKWVEEIVDFLVERKDVLKEKESVIADMLVAFENGQRPKEVAERYFLDKAKKDLASAKAEPIKVEPVKTEAPKVMPVKVALVKEAPKKAVAKKPAKKTAKKK